jgi:hypothetical protein
VDAPGKLVPNSLYPNYRKLHNAKSNLQCQKSLKSVSEIYKNILGSLQFLQKSICNFRVRGFDCTKIRI